MWACALPRAQRIDGSTTSNTEEAALWKRTMADRYGDDWSMQLMTRVAETEAPVEGEVTAPSGTVPSTEPASASAPLAQPPPTSTERPTTPRPRQTEVSSGNAPIVGSPGSGARSPATSWASGSPRTPGSMQVRLATAYDPGKEPIERYLDRTQRIAAALASLGRPCGEGVLELLHAEAGVLLTIYEAAPTDVGQQNVRLQEEFAFQFLEIDGTATQSVKIQALENVMSRRGMNPAQLKQDLASGDRGAFGGTGGSLCRMAVPVLRVPPHPREGPSHCFLPERVRQKRLTLLRRRNLDQRLKNQKLNDFED